MPLRAVVFDLGNTLWFQAKEPDLDYVYRLQAAAVAPLLDSWSIHVDEPLEHLLREIWEAGEGADRRERARGSFKETPLPFLIRSALATRGIDISAQQAEQWHRAAWISETEFGCQLYPDALDVLRDLRAMGIRIAVDSNRPCTGDMVWPGLRDIGLAPYVDVAVCSGDTGYVKPHPSTFDLVLDRLGIDPIDVVMVGDLPHNDMAGAKAVGMHTVWKLNGRYDVDPCPDADYTIHDLGELLALPPFGSPHHAAAFATESLTPHDDENEQRY